MRIIDRYLLRQFLKTFAICYVSLAGLYIVFDAFTNLEEFLRCADECGGLWRLLGTFYGYRSILFFDRTAGLLTLVAGMFTITWVQRHNEMTALLAAGVSRQRIVAPIIAAAVTIALLATLNRELVIPQLRDQLGRKPRDLLGDQAQPIHPRYDNQTDVLLRGKHTYSDEQRISEPSFLLPGTLSEYGTQLIAEDAFYRPPSGDQPGGYLLRGVEHPKGLEEKASLRLGERPVLITPRDAPGWLKTDECFLASEVTFDQLTGGRAFREFSSTAQLIAGLRDQAMAFGADLRVAIHARFVQPLLDMTLFFLGFPLVAGRDNRNVFLAIGLCLAVVVVFMLVTLGLQHLGAISLLKPPALAAWAPLILFVPLAVWQSESLRR
jgi:lipopolysaccharide export system permease protein